MGFGPAANLWGRLERIRWLRMVARSDDLTGWNGLGAGSVAVDLAGATALTFTETGSWRPVAGPETRFRNVFRWQQVGPERVRLEHLRFGESRPVFLVDLAPSGAGSWRSLDPHVCGEDRYSAEARVRERDLLLRWEITGPRKQARIDYEYRASQFTSLWPGKGGASNGNGPRRGA